MFQNSLPSFNLSHLISQKREAFRVEIRKCRQENYFNSKRFVEVLEKTKTNQSIINDNLELEQETNNKISEDDYFMNELSEILSNVDYSDQYQPISCLNLLLKKITIILDKNQKVNENILKMFLKYCFQFGTCFEQKDLTSFCFMLEKIFYNFHHFIETLILMGVIEKLKIFLQNNRKSQEITESVFYCFCHLSIDEKNIQALIKQDIIMEILITFYHGNYTFQLIKIISWMIYKMTSKLKNLPKYYVNLKHLFPLLAQMLEFTDKEIRSSSLSSIFNIIQEEKEDILDDFCFNEIYLIDDKIHVLDLVNKSLSYEDDIKLIAIEIIYKVSLGSENHINLLIEKKIIESVLKLLNETENEEIMNKILVILTNVIPENKKNIQYCIDYGLYENIVKLFVGHTPPSLLRECIFCLQNSTYFLDDKQFLYLLNQGKIFQIFCKNLQNPFESNILMACLQGIENLLEYEAENENNKEILEKCRKNIIEHEKIVNILDNLVHFQEVKISQYSLKLLRILEK